ncbi:hypothetical protein O7627_35650 [Solwaraspora sp. WMMD1047]|uniref:hypothetical protein n=1 Tax=Solwaraspora sp. WMMD1047 TaxID=3016102 RepID=UPI002416DE75|nr:hypothetical protein [Solwaraspora sp. WMMD1047]MDG4834607.1 hypothetical protein [Solwaraspora sp. WMMD1047]
MTGAAGPMPERVPAVGAPTCHVEVMPGSPGPNGPSAGMVGGSGTTTNGRLGGGATNGVVPVGGVNPLTVADPALIAARMGSEEVPASSPTMNR